MSVAARRSPALPQGVVGEHRPGLTDLRSRDDVVAGVDRRQDGQPAGGDLGGEPFPQLTQRQHILGRED